MTIKILGTAACEGIPAAFCQCEVCRKARERGGKELRTRTQALIDNDMLIDLPADTYAHSLNNGFSLADIKYLLITHSHCDHLYPSELTNRARHLINGKMPETLHVYASQFIIGLLRSQLDWVNNGGDSIVFHAVEPFAAFSCGDKTVTALPADHNGRMGETPYVYLIESGDKAILYATDTASVSDEIFSYIKSRNVQLNTIVFDCTRAGNSSEPHRHMNASDNAEIKEKLLRFGLVGKGAQFVATHFSHNGGWTYADASAHLADYGILAAYDGLQLE